MIDLKELIKSGVHFGHQKTRWNPKMAPFIWGHRCGVHLIDVSKTAQNLEKAAQFLKELASQRKPILWVGTKSAAQKTITELATKLNMPYISHRWVGGMLTNYPQVKKSVTKLLHYEDVLSKTEDYPYTKKEFNQLQKNADKLKKTVGGIRNLSWPIGAVVVVDIRKEDTAVKEASRSGIPIVAMVDTNVDPSLINYIIPANDDSPKSIKLILDYLFKAVEEGKAKALTAAAEEKAAQEEIEAAALETLAKIKELEEETEETPGWKSVSKKAKPTKPVYKKVIKDKE
jgi:small subunit ribosomal protein S2